MPRTKERDPMYMNPIAMMMAQRQVPQGNRMSSSMAALSSQLGVQPVDPQSIDPSESVLRVGVAQRVGESDADYDIRSGAVRAPSQAQRQFGQYGLAARPAALRPQAPSQQTRDLGSAIDPQNTPQFNQGEFDTFMGGLDRGQQDMINMFAKRQAQQQMQQMMQQRQMQQRFNPMMGGIMGMAPPQMRGYMPMMQSPMMMGGYMPQQMYGGNPMMGGMMGMAPPQMQRMSMMPQQMMMQGGYMPQPQNQMMQQGYMPQQQNQQMQQAFAQSQMQMQPQQMQQANYGGQAAQPNTQQAVYAQPQQASPFGGAMRGYYA